MKKVVWFVLFLIIGVSCLDQPDCFRQNVNLVGLSFRKMIDGKADTIRSITILADNALKGFYDSTAATSIVLDLNYFKNETNYTVAIETTTGEKKTFRLNLEHNSKAQFVSEDCGTRFIVSDLRLTDYVPGQLLPNIDSIRLVSDKPANPAGNNIEIYRCPRFDIMRFGFRQLEMLFDSVGKPDPRGIRNVTSDYGKKILIDSVSHLTSAVLLPLNPASMQAKFTFDFNENNEPFSKTITFKYTTTDDTLFRSCHVKRFQSLGIVSNDFDKLRITSTVLRDPPLTNVIVFRCPTTNEIVVNFRRKEGSSTLTQPVDLTDVKIDGVSSGIKGTALTKVILPLNQLATATSFTFVTATGEQQLRLTYNTEQITYQQICGPVTKISGLAVDVANTDFTPVPVIKSTDVKFPAIENVEIFFP